jgi:fumarate reductase (CoM/CoB) subunit B
MTLPPVQGCIKCRACLRACPVIDQEGLATFPGPRRLAVEAPRSPDTMRPLSPALSLCTTCGRCEEACPARLPLPEAMVRVRRYHGIASPGQARMEEAAGRYGRVVVPSSEPTYPEQGDLVFFPGCIAHARLPETVHASLALLQATGARPFVPSNWTCCGSPLMKVGAEGLARAVAENDRQSLGGKYVVTACPGCTTSLRTLIGVDAWHLIEHLDRCGGIPSHRFVRSRTTVKVSVHRPCHLARTVGPHTTEMIMGLLGSVPGIEVVDHHGQDDCCGGGGGVAATHPEVAERMARRKLSSSRDAGAQIMVAPCPFCVVNLRRAGGVEVVDFAVFLANRLDPGKNQ